MERHEIVDKLVTRAGLDIETIMKGKPDQIFDTIMAAASAIHQGKEVLYGDYLKTHGSDPVNFSLMAHYADIKRKFVRIEHFVKARLDGSTIPLHEHLDSMMDICVYSAIGVQLILHYMEKENDSAGLRNDWTSDPIDRPSEAAGDSSDRSSEILRNLGDA